MQTLSALNQSAEQGQWVRPEYNWWEYVREEDPGQALQFWSKAMTLGTMPDMLGDILPDTPQEATEKARQMAANVKNTPILKHLAPAFPWFAGLINEHAVSEMLSDPLNLIDMTGVGVRVANTARKTITPILKPIANL